MVEIEIRAASFAPCPPPAMEFRLSFKKTHGARRGIPGYIDPHPIHGTTADSLTNARETHMVLQDCAQG